MTQKKYYLTARRERHKYRRKLMASLKKNGYAENEIIRIADALAGQTHTGKEAAAKKILAMLAEGADREEVLGYLDSLGENKYAYTVR